MELQITQSQEMNHFLQQAYPDQEFIWFGSREAGEYKLDLFSDGFYEERARTNGVSVTQYRHDMASFLQILDEAGPLERIVFWFWEEDRAITELSMITHILKVNGYKGHICIRLVDASSHQVTAHKHCTIR